MHRLIMLNSTTTYIPGTFHSTQSNITEFGILMMVICFALLFFGVYTLIKYLHTSCNSCCNNHKDKTYYKLMGENYQLRKEFKRDIADLRELIEELREDQSEESKDKMS